MCGIAGHWNSSDTMSPSRAEEIGMSMAGAVIHRGPDDGGAWVAPGGLCLAHRRLSIIDLSPGGHQPMVSRDGRHAIAFNGEIYNFTELRREVEQVAGPMDWRGHSDTEVLLEAISLWGVIATLPRLNGMFAIAVWDEEEKALYLARDRFGEKPLYYGYLAGCFIFGSELKALYAHPLWRGCLDQDAIADFLRFCYVPAPRSIFENVRKVMPGCFLRLRGAEVAAGAWPVSTSYWRAAEAAISAAAQPVRGSDAELITQTEQRILSAIGLRMVSDVPLGAFLSGGVDSSLVVALMQTLSANPVKTFSIGFDDERYNEATQAAEVARHLKTEHTQLYVSHQDVLDLIPRVPLLYDEPFADSSQIPTVLVSKMARAHVTVALTGDGGDELFGGYNRHLWVPRISRITGRLPHTVGVRLGNFLLKRTPSELDASFAKLQRLLPARFHARTPGDKLHKLAGILADRKPNEIYAGLVSTTRNPQRFMAHPAAGTHSSMLFPEQTGLSPQQWMMLSDTRNYMPDDVLTKVDRASMSVALEARVPFLDPDLYSWTWRLPEKMKIRDGQGKWVLRQILYRHVPRALVDRPKTGFGIPMDAMLRRPLQGWARDVLSMRQLADHDILNPAAVHETLERHLTGAANNAYILWNLLVLTNWINAYRNNITL